MFNIDNFGLASGRLTQDPKVFVNGDNSRRVLITLATSNAYKDRDGNRGAQFVPLEAFIPANQPSSVYDLMGKGDKISVEYSVLNNNWTDKTGQDHYDVVLRIDSVKLQESKTVTSARREAEKKKAK